MKIWRIVEYGSSGLFAKQCGVTAMRVQIPCPPLNGNGSSLLPFGWFGGGKTVGRGVVTKFVA